MRELNADGTIKNVDAFFQEHGISKGAVLVRKADKAKCRIVEILLDTIKVVSLDAKDEASIPTREVLQGLWSRYRETVDGSDEKELHAKIAAAPFFESIMTSTQLHSRLCDLAVQHESVLEGVKMHMKPKSVLATKNFDKHKLVLVPWSNKVLFGPEEPKQSLKLQVPFELSNSAFWLKPWVVPPKSDNDIVVPYWFMSTDSTDSNMEVWWVKCDDFKLPVARNTRAIKSGEPLVLAGLQSKGTVAPLFGSVSSGSADSKPPKKQRKSA